MRTILCLLPLLAACSRTQVMGPAEPTDPPGAGEAKVVVYRDSYRNEAKPYAFFDDEELLGFAQAGAWFEVLVRPGEHFFYLHGVSSHGVRATLAGGKTYTLRVDSVPEPFRLQLRLTPIVPGLEEFDRIDAILADLELRGPVHKHLEEYLERHAAEVEKRLSFLLTEGRDRCAELKAEAGR